jgi:hypothetical protein
MAPPSSTVAEIEAALDAAEIQFQRYRKSRKAKRYRETKAFYALVGRYRTWDDSCRSSKTGATARAVNKRKAPGADAFFGRNVKCRRSGI